jgi:membrane protein
MSETANAHHGTVDAAGREAEEPTEFPPAAWRDIATRVAAEVKADNVPLLAAGVAFFALLSLFPAIVAVVSLYALVADPAEVSSQVGDLVAGMPPQAGDLVLEQVTSAVDGADAGLGTTAAIGIVLALWSASSGMKWLLSALSLAYDEQEGRPFVRLRGTALALTLAAAVAFAANLAIVAGTGALAERLGLGDAGRIAVSVLRWPLLGALVLGGLAVLYRYGPDRDRARWRWVSVGSIVAAVVAVLASGAFALYTTVAGSFDEAYGSVGAVIVLMLWLMVTVFAVLLGAEINAEMEHQTAEDTTSGPERPLGQRGAVVADEVADGPATDDDQTGAGGSSASGPAGRSAVR